jgi:hypothetical protein
MTRRKALEWAAVVLISALCLFLVIVSGSGL